MSLKMLGLNFFAFGIAMLVSTYEATAFMWEDNTDSSLFELDIKLLSEQKYALEVTGDIDSHIAHRKRGATNYQEDLWPNGIIPYNIADDLLNNTEAMEGIFGAFKEWESQTCLQFIPRTTELDYIEFFADGFSCWSYVGRVGGMQEISLGYGCFDIGTITHEIGHAVGFWHEQSRPDRDEHVQILWHNIRDVLKHNFDKYNRSQIDSLGTKYDYISVMHYSERASGHGNITIVPKNSSVLQLGQNLGLSPLDVQQADLLYKCNGKTTLVTPAPPTQPRPPSGVNDCTFEKGLCGYHNIKQSEGLDDFDWSRRKAGTPSSKTGPTTDHTLGPAGRFGTFVYIETSYPREPDEIALFESPVYPSSNQDQCFAFYYHMLGEHIGMLNVYTEQNLDTNLVFSKNGTQGDQWLKAKIHLPPMPETFKVIFEGIRGNGYQGDIAIDDIHFVNGNCRDDNIGA